MTPIPLHRSKGQPRSFDRDTALRQALAVFWRQGYEPTSVSELCAAMGINAPSLYAAFGNKAQLFMAAVRYYDAFYWDPVYAAMDAQPDLHQAMRDFFHAAARILTSQEAPCGCLLVSGAANVSPNAQDLTEALKTLRRKGRDSFLARLRKAEEAGDIPARQDLETLATTLNTLLEGMSLQARDGMTLAELERIAGCAMALLPARQTTPAK